MGDKLIRAIEVKQVNSDKKGAMISSFFYL